MPTPAQTGTATKSEPFIDPKQYQVATVKVKPREHTCRNFLLVTVITLVVAVILIMTFFSELLFGPNGQTSPPILSAPVSVPQQPEDSGQRLDNPSSSLKEVYVGTDGTVIAVMIDGDEVPIEIMDQGWMNLQISPDGQVVSVIVQADGVANLSLYRLRTESWERITVYDEATGGVESYGWIDADHLVFSQDGWIHSYNKQDGTIVKETKVDMELVAVSEVHQRLILRRLTQTVATPAVTEEIPDPEVRNPGPEDVIEQVVEPAIIKNNYAYALADVKGEILVEVAASELLDFTDNLVLASASFTDQPNSMLVQLNEFDPATGVVADTASHLYWASEFEQIGLAIPDQEQWDVVGYIDGRGWLAFTYEENVGVRLASLLELNGLALEALPIEISLPTDQRVVDTRVDYHLSPRVSYLRVHTYESVRGVDTDRWHWFTIPNLSPAPVDEGVIELATQQ